MSDPDSPIPDPDPTQTPTTNPPPPTSSKASRRLPPPCWTLEETTSLIESYKHKWLSLNRTNLKANHWEDVADSVTSSCPNVTPKKTAVQCRHKMEKLRKRYRTEIQRARSVPVARFISSWVHYKAMDSMEIRVETTKKKNSDDDDDDDGNYAANRFSGSTTTTPRFFNRNGTAGSSGGIRIRIPTGVSLAQPGPRFPAKIDQKYTANHSNSSGRVGAGYGGKRGREMMRTEEGEGDGDEDGDPMVAIARSIKLLGDTMLRTEQTKMEMSREIEAMRMDMEMKRTKMVLESQQRIVEAFAKSLAESSEKKKARRVSSLATNDDS